MMHKQPFAANRCLLLGLFWVIGLCLPARSQGQGLEPAQVEELKQESQRLISFFQFSLNVLGDPASSRRDKETIVTSSFLKAFRDAEVQVEDDLAESRSTPTNKNVQAYLKDVEFFFREARFEYQIEEVAHQIKPDGTNYFILSTNRNLKGVTIEGDSLNFNQTRFFEINLDYDKRDLKIVSIYTTKLSQREQLAAWWNSLTPSWRAVFAPKIRLDNQRTFADLMVHKPGFMLGDTLRWKEIIKGSVTQDTAVQPSSLSALNPFLSIGDTYVDSLSFVVVARSDPAFEDMKKLQASVEMDLRAYPDMDDLAPLAEMNQLRRVYLAGTQVSDLTPLRNLTRLEELDCSRTRVSSLAPLRYASSLRILIAEAIPIADASPIAFFTNLNTLNLARTQVSNLQPLKGLEKLKELDITGLRITDLSVLANLTELRKLGISHTQASNLSPLASLHLLEVLELNHTPVENVAPLSGLQNLRLLFMDHTLVSTLSPLAAGAQLSKIYCDNSLVTQEIARRFMQENPNILVMYASSSRVDWWRAMPQGWKLVFSRYVLLRGEPTRDDLEQMVNLREIDISGRKDLTDLHPLAEIIGLETLLASSSGISSLAPLADLYELRKLVVDGTAVADLTPLARLRGLRHLSINGCPVQLADPLSNLENLARFEADSSLIHSLKPLYELPALRYAYCDGCPISESDARELLLRMPELLLTYKTRRMQDWWESLSTAWKQVFARSIEMGLAPNREQLARMASLQSLQVTGSPEIKDFSPLKMCFVLRKLSISATLAADLSPLSYLASLQQLEIMRNPVSGLEPVGMLKGLTRLSLNQTPVSDLSPILDLLLLEELSLSGTQVKSLKPISGLVHLRFLDVSGSDVKSLKPIAKLPMLERLLVFNTRVASKKVNKFIANHPGCEVVYY